MCVCVCSSVHMHVFVSDSNLKHKHYIRWHSRANTNSKLLACGCNTIATGLCAFCGVYGRVFPYYIVSFVCEIICEFLLFTLERQYCSISGHVTGSREIDVNFDRYKHTGPYFWSDRSRRCHSAFWFMSWLTFDPLCRHSVNTSNAFNMRAVAALLHLLLLF